MPKKIQKIKLSTFTGHFKFLTSKKPKNSYELEFKAKILIIHLLNSSLEVGHKYKFHSKPLLF